MKSPRCTEHWACRSLAGTGTEQALRRMELRSCSPATSHEMNDQGQYRETEQNVNRRAGDVKRHPPSNHPISSRMNSSRNIQTFSMWVVENVGYLSRASRGEVAYPCICVGTGKKAAAAIARPGGSTMAKEGRLTVLFSTATLKFSPE